MNLTAWRASVIVRPQARPGKSSGYTPEKKLFLDRLPAELPVLGALLAASAVRGLAGALLTRLNNYNGYMWPLYEAIRAFVWPPVLAASWTAAAACPSR